MSDVNAGSDPATGAPADNGTVVGGSGPDSGSSDWTAGLSEENRTVQGEKKYGSVDDVFSALRAAESKLGEVVTPLGEGASDEERNAYYQKLGRPEAAEGYEFALPEGLPDTFQYSEELANTFKDWAFAANLPADAAQSIHDAFVQSKAEEHAQFADQLRGRVNATTDGLVKEFGPQNSESFKKAVTLADRAAKGLGIHQALVDFGVLINTGSDEKPEYTAASAEIMVALGRVGEVMFAEDTIVDGENAAGINPWSTATRNLTLQSKIMKEDPERAERLKASAIR